MGTCTAWFVGCFLMMCGHFVGTPACDRQTDLNWHSKVWSPSTIVKLWVYCTNSTFNENLMIDQLYARGCVLIVICLLLLFLGWLDYRMHQRHARKYCVSLWYIRRIRFKLATLTFKALHMVARHIFPTSCNTMNPRGLCTHLVLIIFQSPVIT